NLNQRSVTPALVAIDPAMMQSEAFLAPFDDIYPAGGTGRSVLIGEELFVHADGALWRRSAQGQWQRLPLPISGPAVPYAWGKQVLLSGNRSILQIDPDTSRVEILAGNER